jgi:hypothetical protein
VATKTKSSKKVPTKKATTKKVAGPPTDWTGVMSDTLYRVANNKPALPSRVRALIKREVVAGTEDKPRINAKGKAVLKVVEKGDFKAPKNDDRRTKLAAPKNNKEIRESLKG